MNVTDLNRIFLSMKKKQDEMMLLKLVLKWDIFLKEQKKLNYSITKALPHYPTLSPILLPRPVYLHVLYIKH
jgi:hypothetical protein